MKVTRLPVNQRHRLIDEYFDIKKSDKINMSDELEILLLSETLGHKVLPEVIRANEYSTFTKLLPSYMDEYNQAKGVKNKEIIYDVRPDEHKKWYVGILENGNPFRFSPIGHSFPNRFAANKHKKKLERRRK